MSAEKIVKKIEALQAKTIANGATEAEAIAALQLAARLMKKYNIEEGQLNNFSRHEICEKTIKCGLSMAVKGFLGISLGKLFDCKLLVSRSSIAFYGFSEDVELCLHFYQTLKKVCEKEVKAYKKSFDYREAQYFRVSPKSLCDSFRKGFYLEIGKRLDVMYKERSEEMEQDRQYGLVLVSKVEKVKDKYKEDYSGIKHYKTPNNIKVNGDALYMGSQSGIKADIQQAVR